VSIKIGNNNKIKNTHIGHITKSESQIEYKRPKFHERHPILVSILISFAVGFILLFTFFRNIVDWVENLY
jgi:hypothetical protein